MAECSDGVKRIRIVSLFASPLGSFGLPICFCFCGTIIIVDVI